MAGRAAGGETGGPSAAREVAREPNWAEYLAFAEIRLGITAERFFRLTPRMFAALQEQWLTKERETLARFASLRVELINRSFGAPKEPVTLEQLLPGGLKPQERLEQPKRLTAAMRTEIANGWRRFLMSGVEGARVWGGAGD